MTKLTCVAIDDEPLALELITKYVTKFPALQLLHVFEDAVSAAEFLSRTQVDLLFVDIHMPDITGIDLVRSLEHKPLIIFTTAYKQFALEGFELDAIDYLVKPIDMGRFSKAVTKAIDYQQYRLHPKSSHSDSIFVNSAYRLIKINLDDITFIESFEDYIEIHLLSAPSVSTLLSLKKVLEKLPEEWFKRIHRSYIVSLKQVTSIHNRKVQLKNGTELPIGDSYIQALQEWLNR